MAPWTHTYLSPQTERRLCCASREPAQSFAQYIDTASGSGQYQPMTLEQHWNSEHMRSVRQRMMSGDTLPECEVCDAKLLNTNVYRDYFWRLFGHKYQDIWNLTTQDGTTTMQPVSWDYRFSNLCNFKCRMCGDMLSSAWETEQRQHGMIDWSDPKNNWMSSNVRKQIRFFQESQVEKEFSRAVEEHRIEEIYWVGGEPLMYEQHWQYMPRIVALGDAHRLYVRYNTNLSVITHGSLNLFDDILDHVRDWQVCASVDGTGAIGEYIRTGLNWHQWLENYRYGQQHERYPGQMRLDFTLTLPGLFEVRRIYELSQELHTHLLAKVTFAFTPDIVMSPMSLPRSVLDRWVDETLASIGPGSIYDVVKNLKSRPTFQEQWPHTWQQGLFKGKQRILQLEGIRQQAVTMEEILKQDKEIHAWWQDIR